MAGVGLMVASGVVAFSIVSFTGVAQAQQPPEGARGRFAEKLADELGISVDELRAAQKETRDELIDAALANGKLTAEQAARLKAFEPGELRGKLRQGVGRIMLNVFEAAAKVIGIDQSELRSSLQNGQSLAQIAEANGIGRGELASGMASELRARIQTALAEGTITQEMATRMIERLDERIEHLIDVTGGKGEFRVRPGIRMAPGSPNPSTP
jgi:hypothetical protein